MCQTPTAAIRGCVNFDLPPSNPWTLHCLQECILRSVLGIALCFLAPKLLPAPRCWSHLKAIHSKVNFLEISVFIYYQLMRSVLYQAQTANTVDRQGGRKLQHLSCSTIFSNCFWHLLLKALWLTSPSLPILYIRQLKMKVFNIQVKRGSSKGIGKIPKPCHYHVGKSYIPNMTILIYGWCCWAN